MSLKNKVAIVTGSSRGIGREIAIQLAENGCKVVINHSNSQKEAESTVLKIESVGGTATVIKADVSNKSEVSYLFSQTIAQYGKVDILVNNAGVMINRLLKDSSEEDFNKMFNINVNGVYNTLKEAESKLSDNGKIINFSSSTVKLMFPGYALYSASKAAVEQMSRVFSKEIGRGISVNSIAPGPTETELFLNGKSEEILNRLKSMNAFNRLAKPIDIANVVVFLASGESQWISGQTIGANGAMI